MAARFSRLVSALAAGAVFSGALLFGSGVAAADDGQTIPARCGQTVAARSGDTVSVLTPLGTSFPISVGGNSTTVQKALDGLICRVGVQVVPPQVVQVLPRLVPVPAPRLVPVPGAVARGTGSSERSQGTDSDGSSRAAAPSAAPAAPGTPAAGVPAARPALVPLAPVPGQFRPGVVPGAAPSSLDPLALFSAGAPGVGMGTAAPAGLRNYDAGLLYGSAFPGLRAGAPAYLGYDPASAVTTASQVQALPVDGLSAGLGVPVMLAVLAFAGVAAFLVRRGVLGRLRRDSGETADAGSASTLG